MRLATVFPLALIVVACGATEPRPASSAPAPSSPVAALPSPEPAPGSRVPSAAPAPAELPPPAPSLAALLVQQLVQWDPTLAQELAPLDLSATEAADPQRSRLFLQHRLRQELAVPALQRSNDPVLRRLTAELQRIASFDEEALAHVNLKMGPLEPQACQGCESDEPGCNAQRCGRERDFLAPALLSAAGLDEDGSFGGHPVATDEGVETTGEIGVTDYLQAVEAAGITRDALRPVLVRIAIELVRRSAFLEGVRPVTRNPAEPLALSVLRAGFERWRSTYAEGLTSPVLPELPEQSLDLVLFDAYLGSEARLYQPFGWTRIARQQSGRARFDRQRVALMRAERAGKDVPWESAEPPSDEEACLGGPPVAARRCVETEAARSLFIGVLEGLQDLETTTENAESSAAELALAFERLTLSGLTPARVHEFFRGWLTRAAASR